MKESTFNLYKQILNYYLAWFALKQKTIDDSERAWLVMDFGKQETALTKAFTEEFPDDQFLALKLDFLVTRELTKWSVSKFIAEPATNFLAHMIPILNETIMYEEEYEYDEEETV